MLSPYARRLRDQTFCSMARYACQSRGPEAARKLSRFRRLNGATAMRELSFWMCIIVSVLYSATALVTLRKLIRLRRMACSAKVRIVNRKSRIAWARRCCARLFGRERSTSRAVRVLRRVRGRRSNRSLVCPSTSALGVARGRHLYLGRAGCLLRGRYRFCGCGGACVRR